MLFNEKNDCLIITIDDDEKNLLRTIDEIDSDNTMFDFFETSIANSEWEWIQPEDIGALTSAPILGYKDNNDKIINAYAFMDYQVESFLGKLLEYGEVTLIKG